MVDDEEIVREMAKNTLERYGYQVVLADSGPAAIDVCKSYPEKIALVVLDLSMPGMGGNETLPNLLRIRSNLKVVISSGYSEAETMALFDGRSVAGFLHKPFTCDLLAETVTRALG